MQSEVTACHGEYKIGGSAGVDMFNNSRLKRTKGKKIVRNLKTKNKTKRLLVNCIFKFI